MSSSNLCSPTCETLPKNEAIEAVTEDSDKSTTGQEQTRTIHLGDILSDYKGQKLETYIDVIGVIIKVGGLVATQNLLDQKTLQEISPVIIDELIKLECITAETGAKIKETFVSSLDKVVIAAEELSGKDIDGDGKVGVGVRQSLLCCLR